MRPIVIQKTPALALSLAACLLLVASCGDDDEDQGFRAPTNTVRPGMSSIDAKARLERTSGLVEKDKARDASGKNIALPRLAESDFIESGKHRDPFRPFLEVILQQEETNKGVQRDIKLKDYDVSELRLIAIITNIGDPRGMVVTPNGDGFVLKTGDYVGKADWVDRGGTGGEKIQVNWKVSRIHGSGKEEERGLYLVRDDPTTKATDVTRFMPLHPRE
jgi:Tfp pilus assembly protein PilP